MEEVEKRREKLDLKEHMENVFFPIVKEHLLDEFKSVWSEWLVLSNKVEDQKCPGKLKPEFSTTNGQMISLAPKSYYAFCRNKEGKEATKDGRKGIPKHIELDLDNFYETLYADAKQKNVEVHSLRLNRDKEMTRTTTRRKGLTGIHVKLAVARDRITCSPIQIDGKFI